MRENRMIARCYGCYVDSVEGCVLYFHLMYLPPFHSHRDCCDMRISQVFLSIHRKSVKHQAAKVGASDTKGGRIYTREKITIFFFFLLNGLLELKNSEEHQQH